MINIGPSGFCAAPPATTDRNVYGTHESNGLVNGSEYHNQVQGSLLDAVDWSTKGLKITRLRLVSDHDYPAWDVSYCHGTLDGGKTIIPVWLPFNQIPKKGFKAFIIRHARQCGVYAKGIGILDDGNISKLC